AELRRFGPVVGTLHDVRPFCYLMTRRFRPTGRLCNRRCGVACFASGCVRPQRPSDLLRLPRRWLMDRLTLNEWRPLPRVVVPSGSRQEVAGQHGFEAARVRLVPHGAAGADRRLAHRERPVPASIVFLGGLVDYKGPAVLVEALDRMRERPWQAVFVGDGPMRASLQASVRERGLAGRI